MTLTDLMTLVAGVALTYALIANLPGAPILRSRTDQLIVSVTRFFEALALSVSVVVLGRVVVYRRMPTLPEWLGIVVGATILTDCSWLQPDYLASTFGHVDALLDPISYRSLRWVLAGLFSVGIAIGLGLMRLGRSGFPPWLKTLILAWILIMARSGPLWVISQVGGDLFSPSEGFGAGTAYTLYRGACNLAAWWPMGLLFGVPAVGAALERLIPRLWNWTEWAAFSCSTLAGLASMMGYRGEFTLALPGAWMAERTLVLVWFLAVSLASRFLLMHLGPGAWRWVMGPDIQDVRSADRDASTVRT